MQFIRSRIAREWQVNVLFSFRACAPSILFYHKFHTNTAFHSVMYLFSVVLSSPEHPRSGGRCFMHILWHQGPGSLLRYTPVYKALPFSNWFL